MKGVKVMLQTSNLGHYNTTWNTMSIACEVKGLGFAPEYKSDRKFRTFL